MITGTGEGGDHDREVGGGNQTYQVLHLCIKCDFCLQILSKILQALSPYRRVSFAFTSTEQGRGPPPVPIAYTLLSVKRKFSTVVRVNGKPLHSMSIDNFITSPNEDSTYIQ